jgi:hypothetical protein
MPKPLFEGKDLILADYNKFLAKISVQLFGGGDSLTEKKSGFTRW